MKLIAATNNKGKLKELRGLLTVLDAEVSALSEYPQIGEIVEDGNTFIENAKIKATTVGRSTGIITIADDSGLQVDALGGNPGIFSARYAGQHGDDQANNERLLKELSHVPNQERTARFVCAIAIYVPAYNDRAEQIYTVEGTCEGIIARERKGDQGFGYDPLFFLPELNKTMAELSQSEKSKISHRGKAMRNAVQILEGLLGDGENINCQ
ncbi:XTP/dITP diphosphohydrolase [Desulfitispora alkaliphila]|uniref:XTP/dITP diphosphatase n=1 Tax=Desulfitispora alkaliphila TaxID=622674 RepID=UPI003D258B6C